MGSNLYAFIGFISVVAYILLLRCDYEIKGKEKERGGRLFENAMTVLIIFGMVDGVWGLLNDQTVNLGREFFWVASFLFHLMATASSFVWFRFSERYIKARSKKVIVAIESIPMFLAAGVLISQLFSDTVFGVDDKLVYSTGKLRIVLFAVQLFYFIYGFGKAFYRFYSKKEKNEKIRCRIAMESMLITVITGVFQLFQPNAPYYSVGYMLAAILVFNGSIVIEREKWSQEKAAYQERTTKEIFSALEAIARTYVSIHLFDLANNKMQTVKSTADIDYFVKEEDTPKERITKVMKGVTDRQFTQGVVEFVNLDTLNERMKGRQIISKEFLGKNQGWCISNFIKVDEDEDGNATSVIHAVQNVNDIKLREKGYEEALARAYMNKNAIYAEILKMLVTGVVATDMDSHILIANDRAMEMFGHAGDDYMKMGYEEFLGDSVYEEYESTLAKYEKLRTEGNPITYIMEVSNTGEKRILRADARRLDMLDKSSTIITCFTDITEGKKIEDSLRTLSEIDSLTQIANRRSGESKINLFLNDNVEGVFCLADIDKFKNINDSFGHHVGDLALVEIAAALRESFRENDVVMRIGGDEFGIFAKNVTDKATAEMVVDRLFNRISEISIPEMGTMKIHISLGVTFVRKGIITTFDEIYQKADSVMYSSKDHIGNCCTFYAD